MTDARLALNRLGATSMLGGFELDRDAAITAIEEHIPRPLGLTWQRAALGILEVTTANIAATVRTLSVERGHDPRAAILVAFGCAGPLHAIDVARALGVPQVLVRLHPGVFSAEGILPADIQYAMQRTWFHSLQDVIEAEFQAVCAALLEQLDRRYRRTGLRPEACPPPGRSTCGSKASRTA